MAAYCIGRPDGARMALYNVTQQQAEEIVTNLPEELLELVKSHYNLVEAAENIAAPGGGLAEITGDIPNVVESEPVTLTAAFTDPADDWIDETPAPIDADPIQDGMEIVPESVEGVDDLNELTLEELKDLARELKMTGYSKYKADDKPVLINLIEDELKKIDDVNDEDGL